MQRAGAADAAGTGSCPYSHSRQPSLAVPCPPHAGRGSPVLLSPAPGRRAWVPGAWKGCRALGQRCSSIRAGCLPASSGSPGPGKDERDKLGTPGGASWATDSPCSLCLCQSFAFAVTPPLNAQTPQYSGLGVRGQMGVPHPGLWGPR